MRYALLILLSLLSTAVLAQQAFPPHGVVLMYHRFDENRYPSTNIRMQQFEAQLDYLQQEGFRIWPLRKLLTALFEEGTVPDRTIALSVDDAYLSVYSHAFPLLKKRGLPLTVFVSTEAVDRSRPGYMSWEQMREMQQYDIDFANHGNEHLHMTRRKAGEDEAQWRERVRRDIERAEQRLEEELGVQGRRLLAYPFGEYNTALTRLVDEMDYIAFGQHSGAIGRQSNKQALPRFPISEQFAALDKFAVKVASLPLPLVSHQPVEPEIDDDNPPVLRLELGQDNRLSNRQLNCFLGNGTPLELRREGQHTLSAKAAEPLEPGRSRYNCTAAAGDGRYYWFSQPWFNGPDPADPAY